MDPAPGRDPGLDWFRDLYRRVGEEWLWFSRLQMSDAELAAIIHSPLVEVYALVQDGRDEGLLELDFREPGQCELAFFGVTSKLIGSGAGRWLINRALELAWSRQVARVWVHTCTHGSSGGGGVLSALGVSGVPAANRDRGRSAAGRDVAAACREACAGDRVSGRRLHTLSCHPRESGDPVFQRR